MVQQGEIENRVVRTEPAAGTAARVAGAALAYAAPVLAAAWLFAGVRDFFIGAGADPMLAALGEAPVLALVMVYAVGWAVRLSGIGPGVGQRLTMGVLAAAVLGLATALGQVFASAGHWAVVAAQLATGPGAVFVLFLVLAALLPLMRERAADPY